MPALARSVLRAAVRAGVLAEPLLGGALRVDDQRLDPEIRVALAAARAAGIQKLETLPVAEARVYASARLGAFDTAPRPMARVVDTHAESPDGLIPVRVYQPVGARPAMIVFFHGGGGVIGSIASYDASCRLLADLTRASVAVPAYRLAPEHRHPCAIEDALAVWRWAADHAAGLGVDPARLALAGDSFGGFLAAWVERRARDEGLRRPRAMTLLYPLLDLTMSSPSVVTFGDGFLLTASLMRWFRDHYLPDVEARRDASPVAFSSLAGAPRTFVITAGFDPLRDEGRAYADRLSTAGAPVVYRCERDLVHGFLGMTGVFRRARAAVERAAGELADALGD